jgi:hypothetical protein
VEENTGMHNISPPGAFYSKKSETNSTTGHFGRRRRRGFDRDFGPAEGPKTCNKCKRQMWLDAEAPFKGSTAVYTQRRHERSVRNPVRKIREYNQSRAKRRSLSSRSPVIMSSCHISAFCTITTHRQMVLHRFRQQLLQHLIISKSDKRMYCQVRNVNTDLGGRCLHLHTWRCMVLATWQ